MTRPIQGLHEAAYLLAGFSLLSQVLALVRDRLFAHLFGAGPTLDSYFAAFRVPDLVFAFLTLFVSSFALVPLLSGRERDEQGTIVGNVLLVFGVSALLVSAVLWVVMPVLIPFLFPGFPESVLGDTVLLSRILLIQPVLLGLSSIAASVIQVLRQFIVYALAPILYNLGIIAGAFFFYPSWGVTGLAWGVVLGALLHFLAQLIPIARRARHIVRPSFSSVFATIQDVALPSMPRAFALSSQQVLMLVFTGLASAAALGTVSALSFAWNLQSVPLTVIGVSYAAAIFPALSSLAARGERVLFVQEVWTTIRHIVFWTFPAITLLVVLRAHVVRVILGTGAFSWDDTRLTAAILACFALSLIAQSAILVFSRAYYALKETRTPLFVNVGGAMAAAIFAWGGVLLMGSSDPVRYFFEDLFRVSNVPGTEVLMIPIAYSVAITGTALLFGYLFARRFGQDKEVWRTLGFSFSASVLGGAAAYLALQISAPWLETETFLGIFGHALIAGVSGLLAWGATLSLLRSKEMKDISAVLLMHLKRKHTAPHG